MNKSGQKAVKSSDNAELNALIGIKAKVEFAKKNWVTQKFHEEFGELTQLNLARCVGCSIGSVAVYWKEKTATTTATTTTAPKKQNVQKAKQIAVAKTVSASGNSIIDDEPKRNKMVVYTTENSTKSLKDLYLELSEAHGDLELAEQKIELIETQIQEKRFANVKG